MNYDDVRRHDSTVHHIFHDDVRRHDSSKLLTLVVSRGDMTQKSNLNNFISLYRWQHWLDEALPPPPPPDNTHRHITVACIVPKK